MDYHDDVDDDDDDDDDFNDRNDDHDDADHDDKSGGDDHYSEQGSWSCIIYCPSPSLLHNHDNINWTINDALMIKS